jgi:hypothetical protein
VAMLPQQLRTEWLDLFSRGAESRAMIYRFLEMDKYRAVLRGPDGIALYEEVIELASQAGAPLEEVRGRMMPLLDQQAFDAHMENMVHRLLTGRDKPHSGPASFGSAASPVTTVAPDDGAVQSPIRHREDPGQVAGTARMTIGEAKEAVRAIDPSELLDMSPGNQLIAKAMLRSETEDEFAVEIRKVFHLLSEDEQVLLVKGAFDDPSEAAAPIRRLIKELPEELRSKVLGTN